MDDGVLQILLVLRLVLACLHFFLRLLLLGEGEVSAAADTFPADLKALIDLRKGFVGRVETVHAAAGALEVHDVELLVEEGVESDLSVFHTLIEVFEHLLVHVVNRVLVLAHLKELSELVMTLILVIKVHFKLFLETLPGFVFLILYVLRFV